MYRNIRRGMAALLGLALTAAVSFQAAAQEDVMQEDVMQSEPAVDEGYGKDCGKGCCDDCCCGGSGYAEFQFLYLEGYATEEAFDDDVNEEEGYRIAVGYQGCDGLGLRVRYFDYDGLQTIENDEDQGLNLDYWDVEVTDTICICNLHGVVSGGYRHANYELLGDDEDVDFEGDGVTMGLTLEREISCSLGAFAWAQHSILFGDDDENDVEDTLMGWTEVQLGAQYATCVGGFNTVVRGGVEAQRHEGMSGDDTQDTGLFGWFLSAGVEF